MADIVPETTKEELKEIETKVEEKASAAQSFTVNHPRTAKVVGIVAITAATLGGLAVWKNRKAEDSPTPEELESEEFKSMENVSDDSTETTI